MAETNTFDMSHMETPSVILLVDVDCFEVQVWQKDKEQKEGNPCIVANESGIITSVNHAAKSKGVSRKGMNMRAAKIKCPELEIIQIPNRYGKTDNRPPRLASYRIADKVNEFFAPTMKKNCIVLVESRDEFFIDVTHEVAHRMKINGGSPSKADLNNLPTRTHLLHHRCRITKVQKGFHHRILNVLGTSHQPYHRQELALVHGAIITNELIKFLKLETGFQCSGGVGHNPFTAKMACGLSKPAGIAMMPTLAIKRSSKFISITDITGLGQNKGKYIMQKLQIRTMYELSQNLEGIQNILGEQQGTYFHNLAQGIDTSRIVEKSMPKKISCGKTFKGLRKIGRKSTIFQHLYLLCAEMNERLEEEKDRNLRRPISFCLKIIVRRDENLVTFGHSVVNEHCSIDKSELFRILRARILESTLSGIDAPNTVKLNITATFPNLEI